MFKKSFVGIFLVVCFLFIFHEDVSAIDDRGAFTIENFDVGIFVKKDAIIEVKESIDVNFSQKRNVIFRKIPVKYIDDNGFRYNMKMRNVSVSDGNGRNLEFTKYNEGSNIVLKIGDPEMEVIGDVEYLIEYEIQRGIRYFDYHNELYWNPIGSDWDTTIENASSTVTFEESLIFPKESVVCFTGGFGSKESDCRISILSDKEVKFSTTRQLKQFEGLTVGVNIPKGMVDEPYSLFSLADNWSFIIPIVVFGAMIYLLNLKGRELSLKRATISQYGKLDKLTPGEMGFLLKERYSSEFVSADIVNLAEKGFMEIREVERKSLGFKTLKTISKIEGKGFLALEIVFLISVTAIIFLSTISEKFSFDFVIPGIIFLMVASAILFFNGKKLKQSVLLSGLVDYELENKKDWRTDNDLTEHEKVLMVGLFGENVLGKIKLSGKKKFYEDIKRSSKKVGEQIRSKGYFEDLKYNKVYTYVLSGLAFGFGMFFLGAFYERIDFFVSAVLVTITLIGFGILMSELP